MRSRSASQLRTLQCARSLGTIARYPLGNSHEAPSTLESDWSIVTAAWYAGQDRVVDEVCHGRRRARRACGALATAADVACAILQKKSCIPGPDHDLVVDRGDAGDPRHRVLDRAQHVRLRNQAAQRDHLASDVGCHGGRIGAQAHERFEHAIAQRALLRIVRPVALARRLHLLPRGSLGGIGVDDRFTNDVFVAPGLSPRVSGHNHCENAAWVPGPNRRRHRRVGQATGRIRPARGCATVRGLVSWTLPPANRANAARCPLVSGVHFSAGMLDKSDELRDRIESRKHELLAKYNELKADTRREASGARDRIRARLDELEQHLKSGWNKVNDDVRTKLDRWLEREPREDED